MYRSKSLNDSTVSSVSFSDASLEAGETAVGFWAGLEVSPSATGDESSTRTVAGASPAPSAGFALSSSASEAISLTSWLVAEGVVSSVDGATVAVSLLGTEVATSSAGSATSATGPAGVVVQSSGTSISESACAAWSGVDSALVASVDGDAVSAAGDSSPTVTSETACADSATDSRKADSSSTSAIGLGGPATSTSGALVISDCVGAVSSDDVSAAVGSVGVDAADASDEESVIVISTSATAGVGPAEDLCSADSPSISVRLTGCWTSARLLMSPTGVYPRFWLFLRRRRPGPRSLVRGSRSAERSVPGRSEEPVATEGFDLFP